MARMTKKLVKVEQGMIDALLSKSKVEETCGCFACLPRDPAFFDPLLEILDPEEVEAWRADYAAAAATFKAMHEQDADILKQYEEKGYAVVEVEQGDH